MIATQNFKKAKILLTVFFLIIAPLFTNSCKIVEAGANTLDDIEAELEAAVIELQQAPTEFKGIMDNLLARMESMQGMVTQDAKDVLREAIDGIEHISNNTIARIGVEFRCNAEYAGSRIRYMLEKLKIRIFGGESLEPLPPYICSVTPDFVNPLATDIHNFYGFDLGSYNQLDFKALVKYRDGTVVEDNIGSISITSDFQLQVNLTGADLKSLDFSRNPILTLQWNDGDPEGESSISIEVPADPVLDVSLDKSVVKRNCPIHINWVAEHTDFISLDFSGNPNPGEELSAIGTQTIIFPTTGNFTIKVKAQGYGGKMTEKMRSVQINLKSPPTFKDDRGGALLGNVYTSGLYKTNNSALFDILARTSASGKRQQIQTYLNQGLAVVVFFKTDGFRGGNSVIPSRQADGRLSRDANFWSGLTENDADSFLFFAPEPNTTEKTFRIEVYDDDDFDDEHMTIVAPVSMPNLDILKDFCPSCPHDIKSYEFLPELINENDCE